VTEPERLRYHLLELLTLPRLAKETRLFGLEPELIRRERVIGEQTTSDLTRTSVKGGIVAIAGWLFFVVGFVGAIAFVLARAVRGQATVGDVLLTLTLAAEMNAVVGSTASNAQWLQSVMRVIGRYLWLEDYAWDTRKETLPPARVPDVIADGIDVEGVTFRYPGTEMNVLEDVTLHIPSGATVAIVGENGAGKTTLVKLLSRFYEPTTGRITVDGVDLRRFDHEQWRARMSAAFQDFAKFELLAQENVGVGELTLIDDASAIQAALERASATDVMSSLPQGLQTQLGKTFEGGVDLSGGEWQKLALARAMMRDAPLLLVLDEPTASLDAETEHALFERYSDAARRVATTNGAITVLVSHRFSTVRMADLIVVIDSGRVIESGSHAELMEMGGPYAELYEIQARGYR
jgi:ATP-binding cassette subfamily B protein